MTPPALLVFTDLDGSLLDHHTYDWTPAQRWLDELRQRKVPVIINTSKTLAEVSELAQELNLTDYPCVTENGGAIWLPAGCPLLPLQQDATSLPPAMGLGEGGLIRLGGNIRQVRSVLATLRQQGFQFEGFGDVTPERVMEWTDLPLAKARCAWQRQSSEPLVWQQGESELGDFVTALEAQGLTLTRGGRFMHVGAAGVNKGNALEWLRERYQKLSPAVVTALALGDGANDVPMLSAADLGVLVKGMGTAVTFPASFKTPLYRTRTPGPTGWCEGLDYWRVHDFSPFPA